MRSGVQSEYGTLAAVLLYRPGPEVGWHPDPASILHLRPIDHAALVREFDGLFALYASLGVEVATVDPAPLDGDRHYLFNMMYCRDLLFMTPAGAIMAGMASPVREREPAYAGRTLSAHGIPVLGTVSGAGRFEGADALWITDRLVAVGVGNRTNLAGFEQVRDLLQPQGVACVPLPSYQRLTQHLLGTVQLVDRDLALVRTGLADPAAVRFLTEHGYRIVPLPESAEVRNRQAMNVVTVAPRTVIMPAGCPETREIYRAAGLAVAGEPAITQLTAGAGGLACATGILARR